LVCVKDRSYIFFFHLDFLIFFTFFAANFCPKWNDEGWFGSRRENYWKLLLWNAKISPLMINERNQKIFVNRNKKGLKKNLCSRQKILIIQWLSSNLDPSFWWKPISMFHLTILFLPLLIIVDWLEQLFRWFGHCLGNVFWRCQIRRNWFIVIVVVIKNPIVFKAKNLYFFLKNI